MAEQQQELPLETATPAPSEAAPQEITVRRVIDLGNGAGPEIFEASAPTREEALDILADKQAEAKLNASKKIREQEAELKELRARTGEPLERSEPIADEEYVIAQEFQKMPKATFRKMFEEVTGMKPEEFQTMKQAAQAYQVATTATEAISTFVSLHPDYEDAGTAGDKNGQLMRMKLAELQLSVTPENLHKAYSELRQDGALTLKGEAAPEKRSNDIQPGNTAEPQRIISAPSAPPTRRTSGISTHGRPATMPANNEPSEEAAYTMPLEELRKLADRQLRGH
jgi:hypothetical protein